MAGATLLERNLYAAMVAPMVGYGGVCVRRESGVRQSLCVSAFGRKLASVDMKIFFTFHLLYKDI
jgi:hypothetical protein